MPKLPIISGEQCIKILVNKFGFEKIRQRGSHVFLRKNNIITTVPIHPELGRGLLQEILKQTKISRSEFLKYI